MIGINYLVDQANKVINYLYYVRYTFSKNISPFKLIGEKLDPSNHEQLILFKVLGSKNIQCAALNELFFNSPFISGLSTKDALKLGELFFNELIQSLPDVEKFPVFKNIKKSMFTGNAPPAQSLKLKIDSNIADLIAKNHYPFKLAGLRSPENPTETTIIYTILNKREGYKKALIDIITSPEILDKFHPTEIVKFSFMYAGECFFKNNTLKGEH